MNTVHKGMVDAGRRFGARRRFLNHAGSLIAGR